MLLQICTALALSLGIEPAPCTQVEPGVIVYDHGAEVRILDVMPRR